MLARILVCDDEADLLELVAFNLRQAGHSVTTVRDGMSALAEARRQKPDLIVLDLMLPDLAGTEVCRRLRKDPVTQSIPIVMLTARADEIDRVVGFEVGADDYISKPFSPREFVLRVGAVLRRARNTDSVRPQQVVIGQMVIDVEGHKVIVAGEDIPITALEFRLLLDLVSHRGRVQARDGLLERVWGYMPGIETRTVDTHVKRLREKLGIAGDYIETVRGVGYRLRDDIPDGDASIPAST